MRITPILASWRVVMLLLAALQLAPGSIGSTAAASDAKGGARAGTAQSERARPRAPQPQAAPQPPSRPVVPRSPVEAPAPSPSGMVVEVTSCDSRPATLYIPTRARMGGRVPLVIELHGYASSGNGIERYFQLRPVADRRGFLLLQPNGRPDGDRRRFWNATSGCCDFHSYAPDDSSYLSCLIDAITSRLPVDERRIVALGHSNGAFMAHRLACDHADRIAAIASFAGATVTEASRCEPDERVSVLQIHGSADVVIRYDGGIFSGVYPGARTTVQRWAALNECGKKPVTGLRRLDLDADIEGADTTIAQFPDCPAGGAVELWTIDGGNHMPELTDGFGAIVVDWLLSHPKED